MVKVNFWERTSLNAVTNILRTLVMAIMGIYLVPYYLDELGIAVYGVIPLATTISSYVMIISDSLTSACNRYSTLAIRESDDKARQALSTAVFGLTRICLILVPLVLIISYFSPDLFDVSGNAYSDVRVMFAMILLSSLIVSVASAFNSVFFAYNTLYKMYLARFVYSVSQVGFIVLLFTFSTPSLVEIGVGYLLSSILMLLCLWYFTRQSNRELKIRLRYYDRKLFKSMGTVGIWAILSKVGGLLYIQISLVLVNLYLGTAAEAGFAIISTMISMASTACLSLTTVLEPFYYKDYDEGREEDLHSILRTGMKITGLMMVLPLAFVIVYSDELLTAWVGSDYTYLGDMLVIAMMGDLSYLVVMVLSNIPILYLKNQYAVVVIFLFGIVNTIASVFVLEFTDWGPDGVMGVWTLATIGQSLGLLILNTRIIHASYRLFGLPMLECYLYLGVCILVLYLVSGLFDLPGRWLAVIPWFLVLFCIYMIFVLKFMTNKHEKEMILMMFPGKIKRVLSKLI